MSKNWLYGARLKYLWKKFTDHKHRHDHDHNIIKGTPEDDVLKGTKGNDTMFAGDGDDKMHGGKGHDKMFGGDGDDHMHGGKGHDKMFGGDGDDIMKGGKGHDTMFGGDGDDHMRGGKGHDKMFGGDGDDKMHGGKGHDKMFGGDGDDIMKGGKGHDTMFGGDGDDIMKGGKGHDTMFGGDGDDIMKGGKGHDKMFGGDGDDIMKGGKGHDKMFGGDGDDTLMGGKGNDHMHGGHGMDTAVYQGPKDNFKIEEVRHGHIKITDITGKEGKDLLKGIEKIQFTDGIFTVEELLHPHHSEENNPPIANDVNVTDTEDSPLTFGFDATDLDEDPLTYDVVENNSGFTVLNNNDGTFSLDSTEHQDLSAGESRMVEFTYMATDDQGAESGIQTVTVTVTGANDAPTNVALSANTVDENDAGAIIGDVSFMDVDSNDIHVITVDDARFEVVGGQLKLKDGMSLDHETEDTVNLMITVTDQGGAGDSTSAPFIITVNDVNEAPTSADTGFTLDEDTVFVFEQADFPFADVDDGDSLSMLKITNLPGAGMLLFGAVPVTIGQLIPNTDIDMLMYIPDPNSDVDDQFSFTVLDTGGLESGEQTVSLQVDAVANMPQLVVSNITVNEETRTINMDLQADLTDTDGSESLGVSATQGANNWSENAAGTSHSTNFDVTVTPDNSGDLTVTPNPGEGFTAQVEATATEAANNDMASTGFNIIAGTTAAPGDDEILYQQGSTILAQHSLGAFNPGSATVVGDIPASFRFVGIGDWDGNGSEEMLFEQGGALFNTLYSLAIGGSLTTNTGDYTAIASVDSQYDFKGVGDWQGNGTETLLFENDATTFFSIIYEAPLGSTLLQAADFTTALSTLTTNYDFIGIGDWDGNSTNELLFQQDTTAAFSEIHEQNLGSSSIQDSNFTNGNLVGIIDSNTDLVGLGDIDNDATSGDDILDGTDFDDILVGYAGDDVLTGNGGDDIYISGTGSDILVFNLEDDLGALGIVGDDLDQILDLNTADDTLRFDLPDGATMTDLENAATFTNNGQDTTVSFDGGGALTLNDTIATSFTDIPNVEIV